LAAETGGVLVRDKNCWRIERATRCTVIVDAADYYSAARSAMLNARRQILLLGWDFDARIRFKDDNCRDEGPEDLGAFISWLTRRTAELNVYILRWDTGAIKTLFQAQNLLRLAKWAQSPQVHLRLVLLRQLGLSPSHYSGAAVVVLKLTDIVARCGALRNSGISERSWHFNKL
jgi:phosphatidylserine/phosphatidylglycerophosphate/cardiolipin synthase-like enzyme